MGRMGKQQWGKGRERGVDRRGRWEGQSQRVLGEHEGKSREQVV